MPIDPSIPLMARAPDLGEAINSGLQAGGNYQALLQQRQDAPLRQALLQGQVNQIPLQQQQAQGAINLQNTQIDALKNDQQVKGSIFAAVQGKQLLDAGDTQGFLNLADSRVKNITERGGDPQHTQAVADLVRQGRTADAQRLLDGEIAAGKQIGILKPDENNHTSSAFNDADAILNAQGITAKSPGYAQKLQAMMASVNGDPLKQQDQALRARGLAIEEAKLKNGGAAPSGYRWNPDNTLQIIPGGPADKAATAGLGSREGVMFQRVVNSANSAVTALQNISELPVDASSGTLGVGASPGTSLFASAKGALTNKMASQDVQDYNTMIAGVSRNLSTIETAGLAPNGSLTNSMDSIQLREGDTNLTKLRKLAEMRQIIEKGIETNTSNPKLPQEQKDLVANIIQQVQKSIPFTQHDVTALQKAQAKDPNATLQDIIAQNGLNKNAPVQSSTGIAEGSTATNPQTGHKIIFRGGQWQDQ